MPRPGRTSRSLTFAVHADGCYLITGAFGGFGKVIAEWLVTQYGAFHAIP